MPTSVIPNQLYFTFDTEDSRNNLLVVSDLGDPWTSVVVDWRDDVECGKNTCDGEIQHPESKMASGANSVVEEN